MADTINIRNEGDLPFRDYFDGVEYLIMPGKDKDVPTEAHNLWLGDPNAPRPDQEKNRVRTRQGQFAPILDGLKTTAIDEDEVQAALKAAQATLAAEAEEEDDAVPVKGRRSHHKKKAETAKPFPEISEEDIGFLED